VVLLSILEDTTMKCRTLGLLMVPLAPEAQQAKNLPHIGYLAMRSEPADQDAAFQQGLRELGWVKGQNIAIEYRWAAGRVDRLPARQRNRSAWT
jgi:putative tryptophan/tyrosine transport system substrate-binding protein